MLKVYNTMTRRKEEFRPLKEGEGYGVWSFIAIGVLALPPPT